MNKTPPAMHTYFSSSKGIGVFFFTACQTNNGKTNIQAMSLKWENFLPTHIAEYKINSKNQSRL
jgi:hypothetical protein